MTAGKITGVMAGGELLLLVATRLQIDKELGFFFFKSSSSSDGGKTVCCMMVVHSGLRLVVTSWELIIILDTFRWTFLKKVSSRFHQKKSCFRGLLRIFF